jgi:hypothetical protein
MANEFVAKNGLISQNNTTVSGSLTVTQGITGSLLGTASWANNAVSASYATNAASASVLDLYGITSATNSYLLFSNTIAATGQAVGGNNNIRYNSSTNVLTVGNISATTLTGSLAGTASWAQSASNSVNAQTASFLPLNTYQITASWAQSASQALTASFVPNTFIQGGNSFGTTATLGTNDAQNLQIETNGSTRFYISSSGLTWFDGGGQTTPPFTSANTTFQVASGGSSNSIGFRTNILFLYPYTTTTNANTSSIVFGASGTSAWTVRSLATSSFQIRSSPSGSIGTALIHLVSGSSGQERVGILTENPQSTLDVNGSTRITGSLTVTGSTTSTLGFTGSLFGTASWAESASQALTASYAANGGVNQIVAGTNITITNGGSGSVTINATTGGGSGVGANVTASFTNQSTWVFTHGLGNRGVVIQTYNTSWNQTIPQSITLTDANTATITFPINQSGYAIATLGGVTNNAATASYVNNLNQSVTIGTITSTPSTENTLNVYPPGTNINGEGGQILLAAMPSASLYTTASMLDTYQDQFRILRGTNAGGSNTSLFTLNLTTGNTLFTGAVTASAYSGLPNSWLHALRSGNQTIGSGTWADRDIIFNNYSSNNFTYNSSTGIATLKAGKTYRITARLAWVAAGLYTLKFGVYNQTTNGFTGPTVEMIQSPNGTFNVSDNTLEHIFNVGATDVDISIKTTSDTNALTGEYIRGDLNTQLIIQQIA